MSFQELPTSAAWRHREARDGFESVFLESRGLGYRLNGHTAAVEAGEAWAVHYLISLDEHWITRTARIWAWSGDGHHELSLETDGSGGWQVNDADAPELEGLLDVDLESSSCTNTIPVHRLHLDVGESAAAPAVYVRVPNLRVEQLDQQYVRTDDDGNRQRYDYRVPAFDFESRLIFDESGLVLEYPGIASRAL